MATLSRLKEILQLLPQQKIFVVGDLMWDEYIRGDSSRISPEAPVPVVLVQKEELIPGGATNVLRNLLTLGCTCGIAGYVGQDSAGENMEKTLISLKVKDICLEKLSDRPTIRKTRIIARNQHMLRVDWEIVKPVDEKIQDILIDKIKKVLPEYQAVILSDYDKGVLSPKVIQTILEEANRLGIFVAVDPQIRHFRYYHQATVMTPNEKEAAEGMGMPFPQSDEETIAIGEKILQELKLNHLIITRSQKGMALFIPNEKPVLIPTVAREVYDVTGAGDTVIAVYTAARMAKASAKEAVILANAAAGIVVGKLGTATTTIAEIEHYLKDMPIAEI